MPKHHSPEQQKQLMAVVKRETLFEIGAEQDRHQSYSGIIVISGMETYEQKRNETPREKIQLTTNKYRYQGNEINHHKRKSPKITKQSLNIHNKNTHNNDEKKSLE